MCLESMQILSKQFDVTLKIYCLTPTYVSALNMFIILIVFWNFSPYLWISEADPAINMECVGGQVDENSSVKSSIRKK